MGRLLNKLANVIADADQPDLDDSMMRRRPRKRHTMMRIGLQGFVMFGMIAISYCIGLYKGGLNVPNNDVAQAGGPPADEYFFNQALPVESRRSLLTTDEITNFQCTPTPAGQILPSATQLTNGQEVLLIPFGIVMIYCFWALAIVVDEFFVPALDVIADDIGMSHDVAGATLMAAGGSAPEFFTSLFSAVQEPATATGFGTVVGSAVFNVLFVIAACALFSKETLHLTWWPLARDCTYYAISLCVLALLFQFHSEPWLEKEQVKSDLCFPGNDSFCCYQVEVPTGNGNETEYVVADSGVITAMEAGLLFAMYIGYVVLMKYQRDLYWIVMKKIGGSKYGRKKYREDVEKMNALFTRPSSFRAGVLQLLTSERPITDQAGILAVTRIKGNIKETFDEIDKDRNGYIDAKEMGLLLEHLGVKNTEDNVAAAIKAVDGDKDGKISRDEFESWYVSSEARLITEMDNAFKRFDTDNSGSIDASELESLLISLGHKPTADDLSEAMEAADKNGDGQISMEEFRTYYMESMFWSDAQKQQEMELDEAETPFTVWPPPSNARGFIVWLFSLPIAVPLRFTVPNTRNPRFHNLGWALVCFFLSIIWIALYSWVMVFAAETFGLTLGIPYEVMGVTVLAAGTSVPDLLSSVIVARQGHGDMAVSSSIGSNIFDILVGLPIPWLISCAVKGRPNVVGASGIGISIAILLAMLVSVVVIISVSGWQLNRKLAGMMMILYLLFIAQDLARADWGNTGPPGNIPLCQNCRSDVTCRAIGV